ncbi:septum formation initiator family protein [Salibacteraceae bacterium]|jgi:cell division protein DivIC|nr:septum formation initiator [Crocinitomicaceae bacterium]MDA7730507.1 septum formation initiator family protein [Salibacteraceae bacterium]MDB0058405.1 septum formation initiator family protein [Salibacteraceae bacterium]MDB9725537.1 septum formation initiator family protein [Salibacteraceae bacterium]MDC1204562.1 septum formation initiator family protein [Salibacteraceae bacterium]|tara:strand:- start:63309 stop:63656 length:348 start_codon:yes stop_codon:yes gene_type:complete
MPQRIISAFKKLPSWLRNRYAITLICFFIYMLFFDRHDLISQWHLKQELGKLEENKEYYKVQIGQTSEDLNNLLTNDDNLEKFAREKYLMKKPNEDIFVIVEDKSASSAPKTMEE